MRWPAVDVGQSVAICERACVAVEAMEGTDAMLRRAASLVNGRRLSLVKVARRREHLLFDVPVVGLNTIPVMQETGATVLAVEAGPDFDAGSRRDAGGGQRGGYRDCGAGHGPPQKTQVMHMAKLRLAVVGAGQFGRTTAGWSTNRRGRSWLRSWTATRPRAAEMAALYGALPLTDLPRAGGQGGCASRRRSHHGARRGRGRAACRRVSTCWWRSPSPPTGGGDRLIEAAERHGRILQVGHLERFNPAVLELERRVHAAAVFRNPPAEPVQPAQPGCGRGPGPDDPRRGYCPGAAGGGTAGDPGGGDFGAVRESGYRQCAAAVPERLRGQPHGQPRFHGTGAQTAPVSAAAVPVTGL